VRLRERGIARQGIAKGFSDQCICFGFEVGSWDWSMDYTMVLVVRCYDSNGLLTHNAQDQRYFRAESLIHTPDNQDWGNN
jgi:hypothetical protein